MENLKTGTVVFKEIFRINIVVTIKLSQYCYYVITNTIIPHRCAVAHKNVKDNQASRCSVAVRILSIFYRGSVRLMLALTAFRTQELYHLISSTFGRYLLYEIVKRSSARACFLSDVLSRRVSVSFALSLYQLLLTLVAYAHSIFCIIVLSICGERGNNDD